VRMCGRYQGKRIIIKVSPSFVSEETGKLMRIRSGACGLVGSVII
jgi:hypothetical protein